MATTKKKIAPFQPVFPKQYPQECQSCKTPKACEKFMAAGLTADSCIFICPRKHGRGSPAKPKNDANMVTDSAPGASGFVTKGNRKILLLRAFLIPGPAKRLLIVENNHRQSSAGMALVTLPGHHPF